MEGRPESMISLTQLPLGYRFKPTEEELVTCYSMKKVKNQSLPQHIKLNQWVLCKIYESNRNKKRKSEAHMKHVEGNEGEKIYDAYLWMRDPKSEDETKNGSLKEEYFNRELPVGYRFEPTEEELVTYYLKKKVYNQPLSRHKIRQLDVYKHSPQELTETLTIYREDEWFIFSSRNRKYPNGARPDRAAGNGFWKAAATDSAIEVDGVKVASKRKLDYYTGSYKESQKTIWKMYEYILVEDNSYSDPKCDRNEKMLNDLVPCKIYKNGRSKQRNEDAIQTKNRVENEGLNGHDANSQINNESNVLGEMGHDSFFWDNDQLHNRNSGLLQDIINGSSASRQNVPNQHTESYCELPSFQQKDEETMALDFSLVDELRKVIKM